MVFICPLEPSRERVKVSHVIVECIVINDHPLLFSEETGALLLSGEGTGALLLSGEGTGAHVFRKRGLVHYCFWDKDDVAVLYSGERKWCCTRFNG